ncbi:MAG: hypothetical protein ACFFG0_17510, partial [Candidatus Thorarchaeota archaeon]
MNQDFAEAKAEYEQFRKRFLLYLSQFESWEAFKASKELDRIKYDREFFIEKFIRKIYFSKLTTQFFEQYPYLRDFGQHSSQIEYLYSKRGAIRVRMELFNLSTNELFYPNIRRIISCHSARHSLAMFLQEKDHPAYKNQQLVLYMRPHLTYPG